MGKSKSMWIVEWTQLAHFKTRDEAIDFSVNLSLTEVAKYDNVGIVGKTIREVEYVDVITENCQYPHVIEIKELD